MMRHQLRLCFSEPTASVPPQSDVYRMLHDNRDEPAAPRQSGSFRVLQELVNDGSDDRPAGTRSVRAPVTKVHGGAGGAQRMPLCDKCGSGIVYVSLLTDSGSLCVLLAAVLLRLFIAKAMLEKLNFYSLT